MEHQKIFTTKLYLARLKRLSPVRETKSFIRETGDDDFWRLEVEIKNSADMASLTACPNVHIRRKK